MKANLHTREISNNNKMKCVDRNLEKAQLTVECYGNETVKSLKDASDVAVGEGT